MVLCLKRLPRPAGEPGIFFIFVYFLSQLQRLRPLGYCAPLQMVLCLEWSRGPMFSWCFLQSIFQSSGIKLKGKTDKTTFKSGLVSAHSKRNSCLADVRLKQALSEAKKKGSKNNGSTNIERSRPKVFLLKDFLTSRPNIENNFFVWANNCDSTHCDATGDFLLLVLETFQQKMFDSKPSIWNENCVMESCRSKLTIITTKGLNAKCQ